jgi:hypothetical protein
MPAGGMIGPGLARSAPTQKGRRRLTFIQDRMVGMTLPLGDMEFMPDEKMSQSHTQVVGLDREIIPESGDTTRSNPYRLGCDAAVSPCLPEVAFEPQEETPHLAMRWRGRQLKGGFRSCRCVRRKPRAHPHECVSHQLSRDEVGADSGDSESRMRR